MTRVPLATLAEVGPGWARDGGGPGRLVAARYENQIGVMQRETAQLRVQMRREQVLLRDEVTRARAVALLLRDPATRVVTLNGLPAAPTASGRVVWHEKSGGQLYVT